MTLMGRDAERRPGSSRPKGHVPAWGVKSLLCPMAPTTTDSAVVTVIVTVGTICYRWKSFVIWSLRPMTVTVTERPWRLRNP
jgi:hypothetical protein